MIVTKIGKSVCYVVVPFVCDFPRSVFDGSQSVLLILTPLLLKLWKMDDIRKCGISCLKLQDELPTEQLHDVSVGKCPILICSPESNYKKYRMHSCRQRSLCATVVSMKLLVVDVNRSAITNKCPAGTLVY